MSVVLVCGGRTYADVARLTSVLDYVCSSMHEPMIVHGGAAGADWLAGQYAESRRLPVRAYKANWLAYGDRAGPIRNTHMLKDAKPDIVVAFPGGKGTADMVKKARAAGVRVLEVEDK